VRPEDYTNKLLVATREQLIDEVLRLRGEHAVRLQPRTCPHCGWSEGTVLEDRPGPQNS
jgi:hypothetical protein